MTSLHLYKARHGTDVRARRYQGDDLRHLDPETQETIASSTALLIVLAVLAAAVAGLTLTVVNL